MGRRAVWLGCWLLASTASAQELGGFEKQFQKSSADGGKAAASSVGGERPLSEGESELALGVLNILIRIPAIPFAMVYNMPHSGYAPFPWAGGEKDAPIFGRGRQTPSQLLNLSWQSVSGHTSGLGARYRIMSENHIGLDLAWVRYKEEGVATPVSVYDAAITGNFHQADALVNAFGLGFKAVAGATTRFGPELRGRFDWFPGRPFAVDGTAALALINGKGLWDLRAGAGVMVRQVELRVGYRSLSGPDYSLQGPEAGLSIWF